MFVCAILASAQVGSHAQREPLYFTPEWAGSSQMPDSQQAATGFDWLGREFRNINRKNLPLRIPLAPLERLWFCATPRRQRWECRQWGDRKSTRLNSSHDQISYAVFCL